MVWFVPIESVVRESDFDAVDVKEDTENKESEKEDHIQECACNDELLATSINFDDKTSGKVLVAFILLERL